MRSRERRFTVIFRRHLYLSGTAVAVAKRRFAPPSARFIFCSTRLSPVGLKL
jgi:hypothetical protein